MLNVSRKKFFLTAGKGSGAYQLTAFHSALVNAGMGHVNLVKLSSILPPNYEECEPYRIHEGTLTPTAFGWQGSQSPEDAGRQIAAAVAVGIPENPTKAGLIMEHHCYGTADACEAAVREMVVEGMKLMDREIKFIRSIAVGRNHLINDDPFGAVFAAVVLCPGL